MKAGQNEGIYARDSYSTKFFRFPDACFGILLTKQEWDKVPKDIKDDNENNRKYILQYPVVIEEECEQDVLEELRLSVWLSNRIKSLLQEQLCSERTKVEKELRYLERAIDYLDKKEAVI